MEFSVATLDRLIRDLTALERHHRRELRFGSIDPSGPFVDVPFVTERRWFTELHDRTELAPIRDAVRAHSLRLTDARVNQAAYAALAHAYREVNHTIEDPELRRVTVHDLLHTILAEPHRSVALWGSFSVVSATLTDTVLTLFERRAELGRRAGLPHLDVVESPTEELARLAARALDTTRPWLVELVSPSPEAYLSWSLGTGAREDWPARLTARTAVEMLEMPDLVDGLTLELGRFPKALGPASFLRGQMRLGAAIASAAASRELPFVVTHAPNRLTPLCTGALLGQAPLSDAWQTRRVKVTSPIRRSARRRALQGIRLLALRHLALSVQLREQLLGGRAHALTHGLPLLEEHLGHWLPKPPLGVFPRVSPETPARFAALLYATLEGQRLVEKFDTDWFDNPRAAREIRGELLTPSGTRIPFESLERALDLTLRELEAALF